MKHTPAPRDDFRPGPFGLWALGLAGATRSRWRDEFVVADEDAAAVREDVPDDATMTQVRSDTVRRSLTTDYADSHR